MSVSGDDIHLFSLDGYTGFENSSDKSEDNDGDYDNFFNLIK